MAPRAHSLWEEGKTLDDRYVKCQTRGVDEIRFLEFLEQRVDGRTIDPGVDDSSTTMLMTDSPWLLFWATPTFSIILLTIKSALDSRKNLRFAVPVTRKSNLQARMAMNMNLRI
jgi:hypothetical protein